MTEVCESDGIQGNVLALCVLILKLLASPRRTHDIFDAPGLRVGGLGLGNGTA